MMREGVGKVAPPKVKVAVTLETVRQAEAVAAARELKNSYSCGQSAWRQGLIAKPTLWGIVGEHAVATWLSAALKVSLSVDLQDRSGGDDGRDIEVFGKRIQVKCRTKPYGSLLLRRSDAGRIQPIRWDYVIQTTWVRTGDAVQTVTVDGWADSVSVQSGRYAGAWRGQHMNIELCDNELNSPADLADLLLAIGGAA